MKLGKQWRRAIVYMAWGEKYIQQACQNARSASFMKIPIILITDSANRHLVAQNHPFNEIKVIEKFRSYDMLSKSTIFDIAPQEYDSLLYLDTDTVIIKDISFGFEQAEKHGIALCPATSYCLPSHHDFHRIMLDSGLSNSSQLQYNAGVHFFTRRPDVEAVYNLYQKSAYELSRKFDYKNAAGKLTDQPFFTFAMELLGFNPYTLSINYCYRGIDAEIACGDVFIWHSHHPVPVEINNHDSYQGRRRRYYRGKLVDMSAIYSDLNNSSS